MASASTFRWKNRFERLLHRVLVLNELGRPALAYRLSWAGTAESGYSYGYAQFDLAKGATQHRSALMRLLGRSPLRRRGLRRSSRPSGSRLLNRLGK